MASLTFIIFYIHEVIQMAAAVTWLKYVEEKLHETIWNIIISIIYSCQFGFVQLARFAQVAIF